MHMPVERRNECVYTCGRGTIVLTLTTLRFIADLLEPPRLHRGPSLSLGCRNDLETYRRIYRLVSRSPRCVLPIPRDHGRTARRPVVAESARLLYISETHINEGEDHDVVVAQCHVCGDR